MFLGRTDGLTVEPEAFQEGLSMGTILQTFNLTIRIFKV